MFASVESGTSGPVEPVSLPDEIELPVGALTLSSTRDEKPNRLRAIYTGPQSLVVTVTISPIGEEVRVLVDDAHDIPTDAGEGMWREDPQHGWPRSAWWDDAHYRYSLTVSYAVPEGWSEDALVVLVETLAAHFGSS